MSNGSNGLPYMNLFQQPNPFSNTNLISDNNLYEPFFSKLIKPSWTKTILSIFFTIGITSGSFYIYYRLIKPLFEIIDQRKDLEERNMIQTQKISNLENDIKELKNLVKNLTDNIEKLTKEKVEMMQNVQREMNLIHSQILKDGNNDIKVELAEIRGMLKNNSSRVEYVDRGYDRGYDRGTEREKSKIMEKKESFDDLFERGMSFRKENPYLEKEEKVENSPKDSPKENTSFDEFPKSDSSENKIILENNTSIKDLNELKEVEEKLENKIEEEESENVLENFKVMQEQAEPKLKNSNLFQFINTLNQNTQEKQKEKFDDLYSQEKVPEPLESKTLEDIFKKFEEYKFDDDPKYKESFEFTKEKLQNLEGEELEKAILRFKEKYYQRYVDQTFDIDAYLEYRENSNVTPYSKSYIDIITKLQNNETIEGIQKIDDKPKTNAKSSTPKVNKKSKPWEKKKIKEENKEEETKIENNEK